MEEDIENINVNLRIMISIAKVLTKKTIAQMGRECLNVGSQRMYNWLNNQTDFSLKQALKLTDYLNNEMYKLEQGERQ